MKKKRKKYDKVFKEQAVRLSYERGNVSDLAKELGISSAILYRWRQEIAYYKEKSFPGQGKLKQTAEEAELSALKKRLVDIEMENEILKKAIGIFSKTDRKNTSS